MHDAKQVARYILWLAGQSPDPSVTPMQLLKLVYVSHGWMLGLHGRPLISDSVEAWKYGPVVPSVYRAYKVYGGGAITEIPSEEPTGFLDTERDVMREVWNKYGHLSGVTLSAMTHKPGSPWATARRLSGPGCVISNDIIEHFYANLARQ
jgi:uncharacterized phage-associated protein